MANSSRMVGLLNGSLTSEHKALRGGDGLGEKLRGLAILR